MTSSLDLTFPARSASSHSHSLKRPTETTIEMVSIPKIFVLDPYHTKALELLRQTHDVQCVLPGDPALKTWHEEADGILIRSESRITDRDFALAKRLKAIVKQGELSQQAFSKRIALFTSEAQVPVLTMLTWTPLNSMESPYAIHRQ